MIWITFQGEEIRQWILRRRRTKSHKSVLFTLAFGAKVLQRGFIWLMWALRREISCQGATCGLEILLLASRREI